MVGINSSQFSLASATSASNTANQLASNPSAASGLAGAAGTASTAKSGPVDLNKLMTLFTQLQQASGGSSDKTLNGTASSYLSNSGLMTVQPLEQENKVAKSDDSEYWTALGYDE